MIKVEKRGADRVIRPAYIGRIQNNYARRAAMLLAFVPLWLIVILLATLFFVGHEARNIHKLMRLMFVRTPSQLVDSFRELYHEPRR